ncbi:AAA family ATPase [Citricoccus sp. NPDC055426]|uniref:AAA family ATPase n=1 Tax=Citricoccus sp. NPDC055426 TaxID=3155536 RepID=UPI00342965C6
MTPGHHSGAEMPLVGRARVLDELLQALSRARHGAVQTVVLSGPAGSGKTALLDHFLAQCETAGYEVQLLSAAGDEWERGLALSGYSQLMRREPLRSSKGIEGAVLPRPESEVDLTPARAAHFADTLAAHLTALQARSCVVVAVDDVQLLDEPSLRVLLFALRRIHRQKVLFVLTLDHARAHQVPPGLLDLLNSHRVDHLRLEPLEAEDVRELARRRFSLDLGSTAAHGLVRHTRGMPQPIVELLGELPPETWQSWFPSLPASSRMLARVRGVLETSSEQLVRVAEAVAVLGVAATTDALAHVSEVDELMDALDEGHRARLLRLAVDPTQALVEFVAPGAAEAVYGQLPPSRGQQLHRRAADVVPLEGDRLGHRAAATLGVDEDLAVELEEFVRRRAQVGAWSDVATALFAASRLSPSPLARSQRLLRGVDALVASGNIAQAQMWAAAVEDMPPSPLRSSVLGYLSTASGHQNTARTQLEQAWADSDPERDPAAAASVAQRMVLHGVASWDGPTMGLWAERAMALTAPGTPAHIESEAIYGLGLYAQGHTAEAERSYVRAFEHVAENAQKQRIQMGSAWLALRTDQVETARVNFEAAVPTEQRGGSLRISLWAEAWLARTQLTLGDWDTAAATVSRAAVRLETSRMPLIRPLLYWTAAELWSMRGDWERARRYVSLAAVQPGTYRAMQVPSILARARFHEARADYAGALEAMESLVEIDPWTKDRVSFWPWQDTYVNALVMTNRVEEADRFLTGFEAIPRQKAVPSDLARIAWARGRITAAQGDPDEARDQFEAALGHLRGLQRPYLRARISFAFGQSMRRAGKRGVASSVLHSARDLYDSLGAATYVERCDRELQASGVDVGLTGDPAEAGPVSVDRAGPELTAQERAVAELVATGATNKEAAQTLFVAEKTVQYHLTRIYRKLGIRSRSALAARYRPTA